MYGYKNIKQYALVTSSLLFSLLLSACGGSTSNESSNLTGINNKVTSHNNTTLVTAEEFENTAFITKGNERAAASFTVFKKDRTGVEYLGEFMNKETSESQFTWDVTENKLNVNSNGGNDFYTLKEASIEGNIISGRRTGGGRAPHKSFLFKALPLSIAGLNNKIIQYDLSHLTPTTNPRGCTVRTLKFLNNKAIFKEICENDTWTHVEIEQQIQMAFGLNNIVELSFTGWDGAENKILMTLIAGGLEASGELASVRSGGYKGVDIEKFTIVDKEAF